MVKWVNGETGNSEMMKFRNQKVKGKQTNNERNINELERK
jgi:hypothetical protein